MSFDFDASLILATVATGTALVSTVVGYFSDRWRRSLSALKRQDVRAREHQADVNKSVLAYQRQAIWRLRNQLLVVGVDPVSIDSLLPRLDRMDDALHSDEPGIALSEFVTLEADVSKAIDEFYRRPEGRPFPSPPRPSTTGDSPPPRPGSDEAEDD